MPPMIYYAEENGRLYENDEIAFEGHVAEELIKKHRTDGRAMT